MDRNLPARPQDRAPRPGEGKIVLRPRRVRPGAGHLRRDDDVQRRQRGDAARLLVPERRPAGQRDLSGSVHGERVRLQRPHPGRGLPGAAAAAAVVRDAGPVPQRLDGEHDRGRPAAALPGRVRDGELPADPRRVADSRPRHHRRRQQTRAPRRSRSSATASGSAISAARPGHRRQSRPAERQARHDHRRHGQGLRVSDERRAVDSAVQRVPGQAAQRSEPE